MVIFVGDEPSSRNKDKTVPFVGTPSYSNLLNWIYRMNIDLNEVSMVNRVDYAFPLFMKLQHIKIIALGEKAATAILEIRDDFFKLPHPSPRNRKLNNKRELKRTLKECELYVHKRYKRNNLW